MSKRFSDRVGATTPRGTLQVGSMDAALRSSIWNSLSVILDTSSNGKKAWFWAARGVASQVLKIPADDKYVALTPREWLRDRILKKAEWFEVYNILEQLAGTIDNVTDQSTTEKDFEFMINLALREELAGYQFIRGVITPISDDMERDTIEDAISDSAEGSRFAGAREHLATALTLLSKKPTPDYRNSMKESISAVESAVRSMPGIRESSFRTALRKLASQTRIHPVLEAAFTKLYEYTSDEDGIRHAMIDDPVVSFDEAKFLLVACSAFVNFLLAKTASSPAGTGRSGVVRARRRRS